MQTRATPATTRDLTCRAYAVTPSTLSEDSRSVEAAIASESPVMVFDMARWESVREVLLMDGVKLPERVPFLDSHDRSDLSKQIGSTVDLRVEGKKVVARNVFSQTEEGEKAFILTKEGHLRTNSIGYRVNKYRDIEPGKTAKINGREFTAGADMPLRVTTRWEIVENSAVIIPADATATNRNADRDRHPRKPETTPMNPFEKWLTARGIDLDTLTDEARAAWKKDFDALERAAATPETPAASEDDDMIRRAREVTDAQNDAVADELQRQKLIRELAGDDVPAAMVQECIDKRKPIEEVKTLFMRVLRGKLTEVRAPAGYVVDQTMEREHLEAAMLLRTGNFDDLVAEQYGEEVADKANKIRDLSLHDLCARSITMDGKAIPENRQEMIRTAFSTMTLPYVLGNVANKSALRGYTLSGQTWKKWCTIGSVSNFQEQTRARLTDAGDLVEVNSNGEVAKGTAQEEFEQYSIATYGKTFGITRQNIVNDDMGAFTRQPQAMGMKAGNKIAKLVYTHLLANGNMGDATALFVSGHSNLNTSCSLGHAGLTTALTEFCKQTDLDGESLDLIPRYLIVPPDLYVTATELVKSASKMATDFNKDATAFVSGPTANAFMGLLEVVVDPRLSNSTYTGHSTTTWYLAADPNTCDTIEVAFLNGKQTPTVERFESDPNTLGIVYRVYIDAGVKALDWRGLAKNTA